MRGHVPALLFEASGWARRDETTLVFPDLDILQNPLPRFLVDHRTNESAAVFCRAEGETFDGMGQALHEVVVGGFQHNRPRAGRALLARVSESAGDHSLHGFI